MRFFPFLFLFIVNSILAQPYGIDERIPNDSLLIEWSGYSDSIDVQQAFSSLKFNTPVFLTNSADGTNRIFVLELRGNVYVFPNYDEVTEAGLFLDIRDRVTSGGEKGLLGLAFHPDFSITKKFYVSYTANNLVSRISEFTVGANPDSADSGTERILLELDQPYGNHNGGMIAFGDDGYLYCSFGDGGSGGDPYGNGQNRKTLLGTIIRIDVDSTQDTLQYKIPDDNPFFGFDDGSRAEIWVYGLRNPWRFSFDREKGDLWCGDVGQGQWEEVDLILKGKNYGWNTMEGFHCYGSGSCDTTGLTMPLVEYSHSQGVSITGGYVYRGEAILQLQGTYLYGDYQTKTIWGLRYSGGGVIENEVLAHSPGSISSFGEDEAGEIYVLGYSDGYVYKIVDARVEIVDETVPGSISQSGLYSDINNKVISNGLIPYDLNSPLWSDGAHKERILALPGTSQIDFVMDEAWQFPNESIIVKNFFLDIEKGNIESRKIVETRFLVKQKEGDAWDGFSYMWNNEQSEAFLLETNATKTFTIKDGEDSSQYDYYFPSRAECLKCHTQAAGYVLGPKTAQLNRSYDYESGVTDNQLRALNHINLFSEDIGEDYSSFPKHNNPSDSLASLENRVRAYLDANCSHCHRPGGGGVGDMDLRYTIELENMKLIDYGASQGDLGIEGAKRVFPAQPDKSVLYLRMTRTDENRMPPLAVSVVDTMATKLIRDWINSLDLVNNIKVDPSIPKTFETIAYPNPFNPFTKIKYQLALNSNVKLTIYDVNGREIVTLVNNQQQSAGSYDIVWNGHNKAGKKVSSGVYFYRIEVLSQTQKIIENKKLLLLK